MKTHVLLLSFLLVLSKGSIVAAATFIVGSNWNTQDINIGDGICQTPLDPPENCSLVAAIQEANFSASSDTIVFSKPLTFSLNSVELLPTITEPNLTIDGSSQWDSAAGVPGIVLDNFGSITSLTVGANNTVIKGLLFTGNGTGIKVISGTGSRIGGPGQNERNVFYRAGTGIFLQSPSLGTTIQHNYFGTKKGETFGLDTTYLGDVGIHVYATDAGADTIIENNVIGEQNMGIFLEGCVSTKVRNNTIGLPAWATNNRIANEIGIALYNTDAVISTNAIAFNTQAQISSVYNNPSGPLTISGNHIGEFSQTTGKAISLSAAFGATISDNVIRYTADDGIYINIGNPVTIENNFISYNDGDGIHLNQGLAGSTVTANTIFHNQGNGIVLDNSHEVLVKGNLVGESNNEGNYLSGIRVENGSKNNIIGGLDEADQNNIRYNGKSGIYITDAGTTDNDIAGNIIGVGRYNISVGYVKGGNGNHGIALYDSAESNNVGLVGDLISPNIILDNKWSGIAIVNSNHNRVFGNMIGTDGASKQWGNAYYGINIVNGNNNVMKYNEITNNGFQTLARAGIAIDEVTSGFTYGNQMSENSIYNNGAAGIDLTDVAVLYKTLPPTLQRYENLLAGTACANCIVEFFSGRDKDEGAFFEGSTQANALGNYNLLKIGHFKSKYVTATATSITFGTSEFSLPVDGYTFPWAMFLSTMKAKTKP